MVTVYVTKDPWVIFSFNAAATTVNNRPVSDSAWNFDGTSNSKFYVLTSSQSIAGGNLLSFGLDGMLTPGATAGTLSLSATIVAGTGGETVVNNNSDADKIDYFDR